MMRAIILIVYQIDQGLQGYQISKQPINAVGRICTAPVNDLLPNSYINIVAENIVIVRLMKIKLRY